MDDSLMLYDGDLYCKRSEIKIYTLDKLSRHSMEYLSLLKTATLQELYSIEHLTITAVKRTYNHNIIFGYKIELELYQVKF
ncbi:hypothetical protein HZS_3845 [Henneguya salminicola]|nr:hypothetical protein HZS_3845 [Henneguya salminicola]